MWLKKVVSICLSNELIVKLYFLDKIIRSSFTGTSFAVEKTQLFVGQQSFCFRESFLYFKFLQKTTKYKDNATLFHPNISTFLTSEQNAH
jgi:hypothetical protein